MKNKDLSTSLVPGLNNRPGLILGGILIPWVFCFALAIPAFLWMPVGAGDELTAPRLPGGSLSGSAGIIWLNDYETARKQSAERGLPLFMEVGTEGCPWCRQMDTATLSDSRVIARLKADWVCLRVDGKLNPALVNALNLRNYPTHVYADPTGKVLGSNEGFMDVTTFMAALDKVAGVSEALPWMVSAFQEAQKARENKDYQRAIVLLRLIVEADSKAVIQGQARLLVTQLEREAEERAIEAKKLADDGNLEKAIQAAREVVGSYGGTPAAREGEKLLAKMASRSSDLTIKQNPEAGAESLLGLFEMERKDGKFAGVFDISDRLIANYPDSGEAKLAREEVQAIRSDPDKLRIASEQAAERLAGLYLNLADAWIGQGKPQQGVYYLEKVTVTFPGSRYAEVAKVRLAQIQGPPGLSGPSK